MRAGNAWHRVVFYAKVSTRDDFGASVDTWPAATITTRGEIRYTGGGKSLSSEEKFYSKSMELLVRYRSNIVETMKVMVDEDPALYIISYIEPIGRNEGLRITLEKENA
jgi:head-tail adaptor